MPSEDEKSPALPLPDAADVAIDAGASQASEADTAAGASQVSETSTDTNTSVSQPSDSESRLKVARRFLEDESVRDSPREKKVEFLRSKDLTDDEIQQLLGQEPQLLPEVRSAPSPTAGAALH